MKLIIPFFDKIIEISIYCLVFVLPFSKAGVEICATVAIVAWIFERGLRIKELRGKGKDTKVKGSFFPASRFNNLIGMLFLISLLSMIFSVNINLSLEGVFLKLAEYLLLFFICFDIFSQKESSGKRMNIFIIVLLACVFLIFSDSIFQWITGKDFLRGFTGGARLRASFSSANNLSAWLIVIIPILWAVVFTPLEKIFVGSKNFKDNKKNFQHNRVLTDSANNFGKPGSLTGFAGDKKDKFTRIIKILSLLLSFVGIVLLGMTFSRGAWVGFFIGSCFISIFYLISKEKSIRKFSAFVGVCLIVLFIGGIFVFKPVQKRLLTLREGFEEAGYKKYVWQEAIAIIEDFPILGIGPNSYAFVGPHYKLLENTGHYPHNSYLHMAAEAGLLGLGAFLWIIARFFYLGVKRIKEKGDVLLLGIMAGICAFLVHSFFNPNLYALQLVVLFWVMMGVGTARIEKVDG